MITRKEFYFVRHGQTDYNVAKEMEKVDHPADIPLNATGRDQALAIEPVIARLPVQTICVSPMKRAQETKEIISARLQVPHLDIDKLGECSAEIWWKMRDHGMYSPFPKEGKLRLFMERVREGLDQALANPGPSLIVAHGGVHWAACCLMGVENHEWAVPNCAVVHFSIGNQGKWVA